MRALVLHEFGKLRVEERGMPRPGPGEVLIHVAATGICGSDIHGFTGDNGRRVPGQIMGHESVGRIAELGPDADIAPDADGAGLAVGRSVTFNPVVVPPELAAEYGGREQHCPQKTVIGVAPDTPAAFADYVCVPARNVVALPESMPIEYGALIEPLAVGLHAVRRIASPRDSCALVVGGGPIGQSVVLALTVEGVETIYVSEVDPVRRKLVEQLGATALDPSATPIADSLGQAGDLADIAIDAVGISASIRDALSATKPGGRICLVGMGSPTLDVNAFDISTEERTLVGSFTYSARDFTDAATFAASGTSDLAHLISREVEPEDADDAFRSLAAGDGTAGKVLVRFDS